ncbi:MAG: SGNH/GDSL hydrolase family protein [Candidatus Krumholzibacteriota bacterium]
MKKLIASISMLGILLALLLAGCSLDAPSDPTGQVPPPTPDDANTPYAAIGNSLTAGYMESGLMKAGQANSYPMLIATQMGMAAGTFTQPWVEAPGIGSTNVGEGMVSGVLHFNGASIAPLGVTPDAEVPALLLAAAQLTPYHNLGVPGATVHDAMNAYDEDSSQDGVPFFNFINRVTLFGNTTVPQTETTPGYETASMFSQAIANGPALLTVWIGNNDALGGALSGTPVVGGNITPPEVFEGEFRALLHSLAGGLAKRNGFAAKIVVAYTLGNDLPYFIPVDLFNQVIGGGWPWGFEEGADVSLVTFPTLSWVQDEANLGSPIPGAASATSGAATLTAAELAIIEDAGTAYNASMETVVAEVNAGGMAQCVTFNTREYISNWSAAEKTHFLFLLPTLGVEGAASTTLFSLDGIHPNNRGYGRVANGFIETINTAWPEDYAIPPVDEGALSWDPTYGVPIPAKTSATDSWITPEAARVMGAIFR